MIAAYLFSKVEDGVVAWIAALLISQQSISFGMRLVRTKERRRAVVAVARKLAVLLHRMWIDGTEFPQDQVGDIA